MKGGGDKYDWMEVNDQMKQCMISLSRIRYMIYALLRNKGDISMAEAIISRRGGNGGGGGGGGILITNTFVDNTSFVVPNHTGNISVRIFGGGGGGSRVSSWGGAGGGGGWMNNGEFTIANGTSVQITLGMGGGSAMAGGTSSFGTYLSANGGEGGKYCNGGNGGSGGGGGGYVQGSSLANGGIGYQFGGGGSSWNGYGGNGGPWGGGGGAGNTNGGNGVCIIQYYVLV